MLVKQHSTRNNLSLAPIKGWSIPLLNDDELDTADLRILHEGDDHLEIICDYLYKDKSYIYTFLISYKEILHLLTYVLNAVENRNDEWILRLFDNNKSVLHKIKEILDRKNIF